MKKITIKSMKDSLLFLISFLFHGNAKLKDYDSDDGTRYRYAQWNLPARKTCPHATRLCRKFCYARRDERYESVRKNRQRSLDASKREDFANCIEHTIKTGLLMGRYIGAVMLLRIHESGDFYNMEYFRKWLDVFARFENDVRLLFCFYTKCFDYILNMNETESKLFRRVTDSGRVACSLSIDESTTKEDLAKAVKIMGMYPNVNIYYAIDADKVETIKHDCVCECEDCARCGNCTKTSGKIVACAIH